jgi:hypothetical protein
MALNPSKDGIPHCQIHADPHDRARFCSVGLYSQRLLAYAWGLCRRFPHGEVGTHDASNDRRRDHLPLDGTVPFAASAAGRESQRRQISGHRSAIRLSNRLRSVMRRAKESPDFYPRFFREARPNLQKHVP